MSLEHIAHLFPVKSSYYGTVLPKLKTMTEERGFEFGDVPKSQWGIPNPVSPGRRVFYIVEGSGSAVVGFILVPDPKRKNPDKAWNRLEGPQLSGFR